jgi:CO/xanthine dehydrogenase FAD-binding subunit
LKWIDYTAPTSIKETVGLLAQRGDKARLLAGGTDLLVQLRTGRLQPDLVVDVKGILELNEVAYDSHTGLTIGAAVPCYKIYTNQAVASTYPGLIDAVSLIGGIQIQGRASLGGNLCNAAPSGDAIPVMIALGATARITGTNGTQEVAVEEFCTGPGQNILQRGEMLTSIHFPPPEPNSGAHYMRFIPRNEMDIAVAGAGVSVVLEDGVFKSARVSLASVAPTPLFVKDAGNALTGKPVDDESIRLASGIARDAAKPITDMRGTVEYRKHLCEVLTRRALNIAIQRAREVR